MGKFKEKWTLIRYLGKLAVQASKSYLPLSLLLVILRSLTPFLAVVMPKFIIDSLTSRTDGMRVVILILITVGAGLLSSLLISFLEKARDIQAFTVNSHIKLALDQKMMSTDYANLENPEIADLLYRAKDTENRCGSLHVFFDQCMNILSGILSLSGYLAILVSLCMSDRLSALTTTGNGALDFVTRNSALFLLLFAGLTVTGSFMNKSLQKKEDQFYEECVPIFRKLAYHWRLSKNYSVGKDIRVSNLFPLLRRDRHSMVRQAEQKQYAYNATALRYESGTAMFMQLQTILVYLFISLKVFIQSITLGSFYMYSAAIFRLNETVSAVFENFFQMSYSLTYYDAYYQLLELPPLHHQTSEPVPAFPCDIEFRDVWFRYPGTDRDILKGFSAVIPCGKKLAVVGQNGAGKTTLIYLLLRLYTPSKGVILLNGKDIQDYDLESYQAVFSVVFQDFQLFAFDAAENVAGSEDYNAEKVEDVLKKAGVFQRLEKSDGIHTPITRRLQENGVELSGGEAQKLAIARAIYRESSAVILDEPTAALDPLSEMEIMRSFAQLIQNKTALIISHRLSSCRFCDEIWVIENGVLLQQGSHDDLVSQKNQLYYQMWTAQASLYQEEVLDI